MLPVSTSAAIAIEHARDLEQAALRFRLAAAARGSEPGTVGRAVSRARTAAAEFYASFRHGQLAPTADYCATC